VHSSQSVFRDIFQIFDSIKLLKLEVPGVGWIVIKPSESFLKMRVVASLKKLILSVLSEHSLIALRPTIEGSEKVFICFEINCSE
jgi:hypothetical protein